MGRSALYGVAAAALAVVVGLPLGILLLVSPATSAASCTVGAAAGPWSQQPPDEPPPA